jgi:hypothetical protein
VRGRNTRRGTLTGLETRARIADDVPMLARVLILAVMGLALTGCATTHPIEIGSIQRPELASIADALEQTVADAHADPDTDWHSGWTGNVVVNWFEGDRMGLCYHWRDQVYDGVAPTCESVGWEAWGVTINRGVKGEHHAVLVFDPELGTVQRVLAEREPDAFVLDAWRRGRPDIYPLPEWLSLATIRKGPELIDLAARRRGEDGEVDELAGLRPPEPAPIIPVESMLPPQDVGAE